MYLVKPPVLLAPTVIVLGAGASCDVGYPTGEKLISNICLKFAKGNGFRDAALRHRMLAEDYIDHFVSELEGAQKESIDQFLRKRREFLDIGRYAIASELISYEDEKLLLKRGRESWYYQFRQFLDDAPSNHALKIVTFNYDRSLEHYLYRAIKSATNSPDEYIAREIDSLGLVHIHGVLGDLPWQGGNGHWRPYTSDPEGKNHAAISASGERIVFGHDQVSWPDPMLSPAQMIKDAKRVYFFGFGFHEENMLKLGLKHQDRSSDRFFGATVFGMSNKNQNLLRQRYPNFELFPNITSALDHLIANGAPGI